MNSKISNEEIIISLAGRIDNSNAFDVEKEISNILSENEKLTPSFDAAELAYISSAGLRILMKVAKSAGKKIKIYDVSKEVYDIFETTGFTNILDAQKAFILGVPTAISYDVVKCGDKYGVVYELLNAKTTAQIMNAQRERIPEIGKKCANLLKQLHEITVEDDTFPDRKNDLLKWVDKILPVIEPSEADEIRSFIEKIPEAKNFLHGDFNSKNIMVNVDEFLLIDIGDAAFGHPVFDVAGLLLAYLYLPQSKMPEEERCRLLGFHLEDAPLLLNQLLATYFDLDENDKAGIGKKIQMIMPYANLLASYHGTRRSGFNLEYMKNISQGLIKSRLLPSIREAIPLEW